MFTWFKRRTAKEYIDEAKEMYNVPHSPMWNVSPIKEEGWTVGTDSEGRVVLKISTEGSTMTMSMPKVEAQRLVRMINAAIK
jgi:hypothetical protein